MGQKKRNVVPSRHLVCGNCASWVQPEGSGCEKKWADTKVDGFVFTCKGCTEVVALVKEVEGLRQMVEGMKEMVAGLRYEDKGEETGSSVTTTGVNQVGVAHAREEAAINFRTEEMITGDEGEIRTEERKEICSGATLMETHAYTRNPESPIGKEIDLQQWETLVFKGLHAENEHWRLVEDIHGEVGYAPAAFLVVILDTTAGEEENDATKNNADKEGTTAIVEKYRDLLKKTKQARVGQIIISGILPVFGNRIQGYRNSKRMAVNGMGERLCKEEDVGYVDLWDSFVG